MRCIDRLRAELRGVLSGMDEAGSLCQHHPQLSPVAWHVGHAAFVESHWLRERFLGHAPDLHGWHAVYFPELAPKARRANTLPPRDQLLGWFDEQAARNTEAWALARTTWARHGLISSGYLESFLVQHQCQHLETIAQVLHARACADPAHPRQRLTRAASAHTEHVAVPRQRLRLGVPGDCGSAAPYDNELGPHEVTVPAFSIARRPVTCAQWLGFIQGGGYRERHLWTPDGWAWRTAHGVQAPQGWRLADDGSAQLVGNGADMSNQAVTGISLHEAHAYARWAGGTVPDETQWMAARRQGALDDVGTAWEWCRSPLACWPGFKAFPYDRYTLPWCDGAHFVLKGGSVHTRPPVRRDSFRNFYTADARHVFAGLRLVAAA